MASVHYLEQPVFNGYFEPVNTISNAFFLCAGYFIYRYMQRHGVSDWVSRIYLWMTIAVGLGSGAWHFHQTTTTLLLDVVPMFGLIFMSLGRAAFLVGQTRMLSTGLFAATILLFPLTGYILVNVLGIQGHIHFAIFPTLALLAGSAYLRGGQSRELILPAGLFALSVCFRQLDLYVEAYISFGTHFMWHLLNSIVLYQLFVAFTPIMAPSASDG